MSEKHECVKVKISEYIPRWIGMFGLYILIYMAIFSLNSFGLLPKGLDGWNEYVLVLLILFPIGIGILAYDKFQKNATFLIENTLPILALIIFLKITSFSCKQYSFELCKPFIEVSKQLSEGVIILSGVVVAILIAMLVAE